MKYLKSFYLFENEIEQIPQFDVKNTIAVILSDPELAKNAVQKFPDLDLKKALNNTGLLARKNIEVLKEIYDEICVDPRLKTEYEYVSKKLGESLNETAVSMIDEDLCPICNEKFVTQCRCGGPVKHSIQHLIKGHGKCCPNGHLWSYQTEDGNVITLK